MATTRDFWIVKATHELEDASLDFQRLTHQVHGLNSRPILEVFPLHEPKRAERENCKTPLGVAMSIEDEAQRIVPQFPANFPAGNWQEIGRDCVPVAGILQT